MKHPKLYIIMAIVSLCVASSQHTFASSTKPIKGVDVIVQKLPCPCPSARQTATPGKDGSFSVQLPEAGTYKISYADGPKKGQVIKQVTVQKAGPVKVSATASSE